MFLLQVHDGSYLSHLQRAVYYRPVHKVRHGDLVLDGEFFSVLVALVGFVYCAPAGKHPENRIHTCARIIHRKEFAGGHSTTAKQLSLLLDK